ncbi:Mitogen-activated protein kinase kinase kinase 7 [Halotydeus destructor]|nr:Mitogen-activated protein kinase kinase kinase 7 [Halotydeus destructor]
MEVNDHIFVPQIPEAEIQFDEVAGFGSYGIVKKGQWQGRDVAVKLYDMKKDGQSVERELTALSRLDHPNIINIFGSSTRGSVTSGLVMEYAEEGSLFNLLHRMPEVSYSEATAISWLLQCAKGLSYMHGQEPRPMAHRDFKSSNLLLFNGRTLIKICDFGTARDVQTIMTSGKGTTNWMAPEVFDCDDYTEQCDVYSWAVTLWEVLAREVPFDECETPFAVMWALEQGRRPPLDRLSPNCPQAIKNLMKLCWREDPLSRPKMAQVAWELEDISICLTPMENSQMI